MSREDDMKMIGFGIGASMLLATTALLNACSTDCFQQKVSGRTESSSDAPAPDLPAAISIMQSQTIYTDLVELRHYSAYNAFRALLNPSSSGSGSAEETSATTGNNSCFGNQ